MTGLANLQALFQDHVVNGTDDAVKVFVGDHKASAAERAGVYYDAYRLRLIEILRIDFPGLCALVSEEEFDALGERYLAAHPSHYPTVRWFGRNLSAFLATDPVFAEQPYLAEMASFEWARGKAFDAANADVVSVEDLGAVPADEWPSLCLDFHPTLQRSESAWNIGDQCRRASAGAGSSRRAGPMGCLASGSYDILAFTRSCRGLGIGRVRRRHELRRCRVRRRHELRRCL
jgi:hypothetical protein